VLTVTTTTPSETVTLTISDFTVTIENTQPCTLPNFLTLSTAIKEVVSADGTNTLNFDPTTLVTVAPEMTSCSSETVTVVASLTQISNNRDTYIQLNSNKVQWVNTAGDFKPPVYANGRANYEIAYTITTQSASTTLSIEEFLFKVVNTVPCLTTHATLVTGTSLTVSADGTNTLNFDPTTLV